ncbi:MAG: cellulose biosynthesis cyclic di-GMP-binding regulatory protein BcsB, partial [Myxococcota bacterium]
MMSVWLMASVVLTQSPSNPPEEPNIEAPEPVERVARRDLAQLGFDPKARGLRIESYVDLPLLTRADRVLNRAELVLVFDGELKRDLEVAVNHERIGTISADAVSGGDLEQSFTLNPLSLSGNDTITLKFVGADLEEAPEACREVEAGAWSALTRGYIEVGTSILPLPNDVSLFPLPFVDPRIDDQEKVALVMPGGARSTRAAILLAAGFNRITGIEPRFSVHREALPEAHAVVLLAGEEEAKKLGLPFEAKPTAFYATHPTATNLKLLVFSGDGVEALETAVLGMFVAEGRSGSELAADPRKVAEAIRARVGSLPTSWTSVNEPLALGSLVDGDLVHEGGRTKTLSVGFRIPPDLFVWPAQEVPFEVHYGQTTALGQAPARIDVEFNGRFLTTLPAIDGGDRRVELRLHRDSIRGYNALNFHVRYPESVACIAGEADEGAVTIYGDSKFHFEKLPRFAVVPDVDRFVNDGYPFSRRGDLGETTVVLSSTWQPREIEAVLSVFTHLAAVTEDLPTGVEVLSEAELPETLDRDLLLVGSLDTHRLVAQWREEVPATLGHRGFELIDGGLLGQLRNSVIRSDRQRAEDLLLHQHETLAVLSG